MVFPLNPALISLALADFYVCLDRPSPMAQWVKNPPATQETQKWVSSLGWEDPQGRKWQRTPKFLPEKSHGQRSLMGYSSKGCKESDMIEQLTVYALYISILSLIYIYIYIYVYRYISFFILQAKYSNCFYYPLQILALQLHLAKTFPSIYLIPWS